MEYSCEKTGKKTTIPLEQPRLNSNAIPSIFEGCPKYLSSKKSSREEPDAKKRRIECSQLESVIAESLQTFEHHNNKFKIESLDELKEKVSFVDLPLGFNTVSKNGFILFVKITLESDVPQYLTVVINPNLCLNIFKGDVCLKKIHDLNLPINIQNVQDISNVLSVLDKHCNHKSNDALNLICTIKRLIDELESMSSHSEKLSLNFIKEQLSLIFNQKNQNRYSSDVLILSSLILSISPHAYNFLRNSDVLVLPHPSTLKKLLTSCNLNPKHETDDNFLCYIKQKFQYLSDNDKTVTLMMDEIHLKSYLDFKGGSILGMSYNCSEAANSAYVFMVQSVQSSYKDVVAIMPVKTVNADMLFEFTRRVLIGLETIGLHAFCIITDNNAINRKAVSKFTTPPKVQIVYPHPYDIKKKLFFMIDSVHILKCVRNNWVNQKNPSCSMFYPKFPSKSDPQLDIRLKTASFQAIRKLYEHERANLIRYAPTLTTKSLFPTKIERQNVKLAVNIFNNKLVDALNTIGDTAGILDSKSTANYIEIIVNWWEVMNVRTILKGIHKRNVFQEPMKLNDFRFQFLEDFLIWLDTWKDAKSDTGRLTQETHLALSLTTHAIREITRYCTEELHMKFILTGKFQTDSLEDRFGRYRQLAGGQYDISATQLFETEAKLRLQTTLPLILKSQSLGDINIEIVDCDINSNDVEVDDPDTSFTNKLNVKVLKKDVEQTKSIMPVLVYIAGYSVHSVLKYLNNCQFCNFLLTRNDEIFYHENHVLIHHQDRGGLKYPTDDVINIVTYAYIVITKLLSEHEDSFLKAQNHRQVAISVVSNVLELSEKYLSFDTCADKHSSNVISKCIVKKVVNILLNNYCKKKNDLISYVSHSKAQERKLKTLMKATKNQS